MKQLLLIMGLFLALTSCKKYEGNYQQVPEPVDTTSWQDNYQNGGVLPGGGGTSNQSSLVGTTWVLKKVVSAFATTYPNDTIHFVTASAYVLNQNAQRPYSFSGITGSTNKSLSLYFFYPFGGSNYSGQIGQYAVEDGFMSGVQFTDLQNNSPSILAWFEKI